MFDSAHRPADIVNQTFSLKRRGFDRHQVQAYLAEVADCLAEAQGREADTRSRLAQAIRRAEKATAALQAQPVPPIQIPGNTADLKPAADSENLQRAQAEAHEVIAQARIEADALLTRARIEAQATKLDAVDRLQQASDLSEALVREAREARGQILEDMDRRRRHARAQVERLRVGRDRLLRSYDMVRRSLDESTQELKGSLKEAKLRGDAAARTVTAEPVATRAELEAELRDAKLIGRITTTPTDLEPLAERVLRSPALPRPLAPNEKARLDSGQAVVDLRSDDSAPRRSAATRSSGPKAPAMAPLLTPTPAGAERTADPIAAMMEAVEAKHGKADSVDKEPPLDSELAQLADADLNVLEPNDEIEEVRALPLDHVDALTPAEDTGGRRQARVVITGLEAQRDAVIAEAAKQLESKLKLALAQEQNELLAGLHSTDRPHVELTSLVGDVDRQLNRYMAAINDVATDAYGAGAALIDSASGERLLPAGAIEELLESDVVLPIRERLQSLDGLGASEPANHVDHVRELYLHSTVDHVGFAASRLANLLCVAGVCDALPDEAEVPWKTPS